MAAAQGKTFRIEKIGVVSTHSREVDDETARHRELMSAIGELRDQMAPRHEESVELLERYRHELEEASKIKGELDEIYRTIAETKREIATLHHTGFGEEQIYAVSNQLDAVVSHTESATDVILGAAEQIDNDAANLVASLSGSENEMAADIQDQVIKIFESCNFQDITGQRITKVVEALKFIEERVGHMIEIWGGIDSFTEFEPVKMKEPEGHEKLLNGPALPDAGDVASQDDIDALFD